MRKITEEDVINFYMPFVLQECKNAYKGLEWEERIAEGTKTLIYAIRTYKIRYGDFKEYMLTQLRKRMKRKNAEAWAAQKLNSSISLDSPLINGQDDFTLTKCMTTMVPDESVLYVKCFIGTLTPKEQSIVLLRMQDYSISNISNRVGLPVHEVQSILDGIKGKIAVYSGDNLCAS